jgi:hypothetical protein
MAKNLPREISSLIHHVALNEQGWWDKTIQRLIISSLYSAEGKQLTIISIEEFLSKQLKVFVDSDKLNKQIEKLCTTKTILRVNKDEVKLTEAEIQKVTEDLRKFDEIEEKTKNSFNEIINRECNEEEKKVITWDSFNSDLLIPILCEFGAKTYELITGKGLPLDGNVKFKKYLSQFPIERHIIIRNAIIDFLNPNNTDVRNLILRKLNAFFFLEAANLPAEAVEKISNATKKQPTFKVFIDTNFLFSILGLHENPSNEAAQALIETILKVSNKVKFKFYISPLTIDETRKVILNEEQRLKNLRPTQLISKVAIDYISNGFSKKYFEECLKANKSIKAEDYFSPYLDSMVTVLRSKGVEIYNDNKFEGYTTNQKVIDDIVEQQEWEKKKLPTYLQKSYEKLKHDFVLWHFVNDLRPAYVETADQAEYFVVTIDFRFINFDSQKRRKNRRMQVPICIHPTNLIQILQLWVPRDAEFEAAVLSNLRFPFLFTEFDADAEYTTIRIIDQISRYENIDDLPEDTLRSVLFNKALRAKIEQPEYKNKESIIIKEAIIEENIKVRELAELNAKRITELNKDLKDKDKEIENISNALKAELQNKQGFQSSNLELQKRIENLEKERKLEKKLNDEKIKWHKDKEFFILKSWDEYPKRKALFYYFLLSVIIVIGAMISLYIVLKTNEILRLILPIVTLIGGTIGLSFFNREKIIQSFKYNFRTEKFRKRKMKEFEDEYIKSVKEPDLNSLENDVQEVQ